MPDGYLTILEERIEGEYKTIAFIGSRTKIGPPEHTNLFEYILSESDKLDRDTAIGLIRTKKIYDGFHINHEERTVEYNGELFPLDPQTIVLNSIDEEIDLPH